MDKNIDKNVSRNLSSKHSQKRLDYTKISARDTFKTASKTIIWKNSSSNEWFDR